MVKNFSYILLFFIILLVIIFYNKHIDNFYNDKKIVLPEWNIGNVISAYFFYIHKAYLNGEKNIKFKINNKLLSTLLPDKIVINKKITSENKKLFIKLTHKYLIRQDTFWSNKNLIKDIYPILKKNIKLKTDFKKKYDCVIHFRCSDVPFERNPYYHLIKYNWYYNAVKICLKYIKIKNILILSCNDHLSNKKKTHKCSKWIKQLEEYLKQKLNIPIEIGCNSIEEDIKIMVNSKSLISSNGSLSLLLGVLSNNIFVYPSDDYENTQMDCVKIRPKSFCLKKEYLKHSEVKDYFEVNENLLND